MDQDGFNVRNLTNGNDLVLTPRFSPNRQEVTYMSLRATSRAFTCCNWKPDSAKSSATSPA